MGRRERALAHATLMRAAAARCPYRAVLAPLERPGHLLGDARSALAAAGVGGGTTSEPGPTPSIRPTLGFRELEAALRETGMIGADIHSYGTLTPSGERHARERWQSSRPLGAFGGPPRLARPFQRAGSVIARRQDRACPNRGAHAGWLSRRRSKRWEELRGRGEADFTCPQCAVRWTIYLEATGANGAYDPCGDPAICRPRWRYRGGWLHGDAHAPPDHHPSLAAA